VQAFPKPVKGEWNEFPDSLVQIVKELQSSPTPVQKHEYSVSFSKTACDNLEANKPETSGVYCTR
jgi:hypothetical protein